MTEDLRPREIDDITFAEWILYTWIDVTIISSSRSCFVRGRRRPLDESMRLAGGSIKDLRPYLRDLDLIDLKRQSG